VRGAFLHMAQDAVASLTVVVAALLARAAWAPMWTPSRRYSWARRLAKRSSLAWQTLSTILEGYPAMGHRGPGGSCASAFAPACLHHIHVWELGPTQRPTHGPRHRRPGHERARHRSFLSRLKGSCMKKEKIRRVEDMRSGNLRFISESTYAS